MSVASQHKERRLCVSILRLDVACKNTDDGQSILRFIGKNLDLGGTDLGFGLSVLNTVSLIMLTEAPESKITPTLMPFSMTCVPGCLVQVSLLTTNTYWASLLEESLCVQHSAQDAVT